MEKWRGKRTPATAGAGMNSTSQPSRRSPMARTMNPHMNANAVAITWGGKNGIGTCRERRGKAKLNRQVRSKAPLCYELQDAS